MGNAKEEKYVSDLLDGLYGIEGSFTQYAIFEAIKGAGAIISALNDKLEPAYPIGKDIVNGCNIYYIFIDIANIIYEVEDYNNGASKAAKHANIMSSVMDMLSRGIGSVDALGGIGSYLSMVLSVGSVCLDN